VDKKKVKHINYALVETTRPPMYKATKYWGKKPHNIWSQFIANYTEENDWVLDPFSGSAVAAFEAVKIGRKAIALDLNPMTSFMIESTVSDFDEELFVQEFKKINSAIEKDEIYIKHFLTEYNGSPATIYNYKWEDGVINKIALKTKNEQISIDASFEMIELSKEQENIENPYWFPVDEFPNNPSITQKFIEDIGGKSFNNLWTVRNLYLISKIFSLILENENESIKLQLLSGFVQTIHLCSKMVVPRNPKSNRDFSGSWGRPDYMIRRRSMEQNPLIVFERSCIGKQSILSALIDFKEKFPDGIRISDITETKKVNKRADINYGRVDVADLDDYIKPNSINFIITDPPYAGLVFYMDLSLIWLVWLQKFNPKYIPDLRAEITIKKDVVERTEYIRRLENAFKKIHKVLIDDGYLVVTFHHKKIQEWNDFVRCVKLAGFKFDKITHQYNKRSGEANVANPYGTSGADFYIRCVKHREVDFSDDQSGLKHFIEQKAIQIIAERNQPTPLTILVSGLIPELLQAGFFQPEEYRSEIESILNENCGDGKIFKQWENKDNKSGSYWWFNNPNKFINYPDLPLDRRVEDLIISELRRKVSVKFDDIIGVLFKTFPNGLTPDPRGIVNTLKKYAYKSSEKWKIKDETISDITNHTKVIEQIIKAGRRCGYLNFIGKREQPEPASNGKRLSDLVDAKSLKEYISANKIALKRIEMIDAIWFVKVKDSIKCIFEVENSTDFTTAIQRGSNLGKNIYKIMVIPEEREKELLRITDPYFIAGFNEHNWKYLTYLDIQRLSSYSNLSLESIIQESKNLDGKSS